RGGTLVLLPEDALDVREAAQPVADQRAFQRGVEGEVGGRTGRARDAHPARRRGRPRIARLHPGKLPFGAQGRIDDAELALGESAREGRAGGVARDVETERAQVEPVRGTPLRREALAREARAQRSRREGVLELAVEGL